MAQLQFKGKQFVQNHHLLVKYRELEPKKDKSLTNKISLHDNLIIHGDNLDSLKALLPIYAGKVKCIYIDPPYNTGNEGWVYSDNVNSPMIQEWLKANKPVDNEDLTRHDKWLCMMMPRLKLLREFLSDDGVIFISIDDNEFHHLRMLMSEIFGDENFIGNFIWKNKAGGGKQGVDKRNEESQTKKEPFVTDHEYIIVYAKNIANIDRFLVPLTEDEIGRYKNLDKDPDGPYLLEDLERAIPGSRSNNYYAIKDPDGVGIKPKGGRFKWRYIENTFKEELKQGHIYWHKVICNPSVDKRGYYYRPKTKQYLYQNEQIRSKSARSILYDLAYTRDGAIELRELFNIPTDSKELIDNPKPVELLKQLISLSTKGDDLILDSFAGSGTTGHAVLSLNKEDGGNRKFILVEMEDYADKLTAERIRRVIKGTKNSKDEKLNERLRESFSYFELGKPIEIEHILSGSNLPTYKELARYVFYTATGDEFDETKVNEESGFIGETKDYHVYLFYKPDLDYLKNSALTLKQAEKLGKPNGKKRLVFAPTKYLDQDHLDQYKIEFAQLPFEIYR